VIPPRCVPPPAGPPPGRISVRGLHVAMPMEVDEFAVPAPEGSSPKVLATGGLPATQAFSKSAGVPLPTGDLGTSGAHPKDASQALLEDMLKNGA